MKSNQRPYVSTLCMLVHFIQKLGNYDARESASSECLHIRRDVLIA
jgi:hypothetical protein